MKDKPFFCEAEKDGYCTSSDYICPEVAEYYYPEEGEEEK